MEPYKQHFEEKRGLLRFIENTQEGIRLRGKVNARISQVLAGLANEIESFAARPTKDGIVALGTKFKQADEAIFFLAQDLQLPVPFNYERTRLRFRAYAEKCEAPGALEAYKKRGFNAFFGDTLRPAS